MPDKNSDVFYEEAAELLADIESALLELEEQPGDSEIIARIFRAMHTIKGSGAMFGFEDVANFTHHVETLLDRVRNGTVPVTRNLIDLVLASRDQISAMLEATRGGNPYGEEESARIIAGLGSLMSGDTSPIPQAKPLDNKKDIKEGRTAIWHVRFRPSRDAFSRGMDPAVLLDDLRELGECRVTAHTEDIPPFNDVDPELCYLFWDIIITTDKGLDAIKGIFIFVEDESEITIRPVGDAGGGAEGAGKKLIGEILVERGDINEADIQSVLKEKKLIGEMLVEKGAVTPSKVEAALAEQKTVEKHIASEKLASVRVPAEKLDKPVNLVGEMVITQATLAQASLSVGAPELAGPVEVMERLTSELRDIVMGVRMMPIGSTFSKFKRLVRDLSIQVGKEVELITEGGETELDKNVIDRLNDPLVHLIRNSIDHGIELPDQREAAGKPRGGAVRLAASHSGDKVVITVEDDGKGLDGEAIREKAVSLGLAEPDTELTDSELYSLIFLPGFSTARKVTSISGRGVGMDVVKKEIDSLRGTVEISSERGCGSRFTVSLPLTLAIIDGLLVSADENRYVIPLSFIEECVELSAEERARSHGRELANVRGELVPYIPLRKFFRIDGPVPGLEHMVIVRVNGSRVGILADRVVGDYQTVIKSLGKTYEKAEGLSGATILGDGRVALIIDVPKLVKSVEEEVSGTTGVYAGMVSG